MSATPKILLDASKLYGFRILERDAALMVKVGAKMGAKIGGKVGDKIGFKRSVVQDSSAW
jgi:hypothetical protein